MTTLRDYILQEWPELAAAGNYPAIAEAGNAASSLPNPEAQGTVPAPVTLKQVLALVPPAEGAKVFAMAGFVDNLRNAIDNNDHDYMAYMMQVAFAAGAISAATAAALQPLLTATVPDPAWMPTIAGPSAFEAAGYGVVSAADVQGALHATAL